MTITELELVNAEAVVLATDEGIQSVSVESEVENNRQTEDIKPYLEKFDLYDTWGETVANLAYTYPRGAYLGVDPLDAMFLDFPAIEANSVTQLGGRYKQVPDEGPSRCVWELLRVLSQYHKVTPDTDAHMQLAELLQDQMLRVAGSFRKLAAQPAMAKKLTSSAKQYVLLVPRGGDDVHPNKVYVSQLTADKSYFKLFHEKPVGNCEAGDRITYLMCRFPLNFQVVVQVHIDNDCAEGEVRINPKSGTVCAIDFDGDTAFFVPTELTFAEAMQKLETSPWGSYSMRLGGEIGFQALVGWLDKPNFIKKRQFKKPLIMTVGEYKGLTNSNQGHSRNGIGQAYNAGFDANTLDCAGVVLPSGFAPLKIAACLGSLNYEHTYLSGYSPDKEYAAAIFTSLSIPGIPNITPEYLALEYMDALGQTGMKLTQEEAMSLLLCRAATKAWQSSHRQPERPWAPIVEEFLEMAGITEYWPLLRLTRFLSQGRMIEVAEEEIDEYIQLAGGITSPFGLLLDEILPLYARMHSTVFSAAKGRYEDSLNSF
jgi:hypothetical protein